MDYEQISTNVSCLFDRVPPDDRVEDRIDRLSDVLDQNCVSGGNCTLYGFKVVLVSQPHDHQLVTVLGPDPLHSLQLRVDHKRPALGVRQYRGVLGRHPVAWQPFIVPPGHLGVVGQQRQRIEVLRDRDRVFEGLEVRDPVLVHQVDTVLLRETADVGEEGRDEQDVTRDGLPLDLEAVNSLGPADVFRRQSSDQTVGKVDRLVRAVRFLRSKEREQELTSLH